MFLLLVAAALLIVFGAIGFSQFGTISPVQPPAAVELRSYGIGANRKALAALFRYSHRQGLTSRELTIEELFHH